MLDYAVVTAKMIAHMRSVTSVLIAKGVFTQEELDEAIRAYLERIANDEEQKKD